MGGCARCKKKILVTLYCTHCGNEQKLQIREGNNPLAIVEKRGTVCNRCSLSKFVVI